MKNVQGNKGEAINHLLVEVAVELESATKNYPDFGSAHEGYAVLKEEVDELWDSIKLNEDGDTMRKEATQIAAMAVRFILDCCVDGLGDT